MASVQFETSRKNIRKPMSTKRLSGVQLDVYGCRWSEGRLNRRSKSNNVRSWNHKRMRSITRSIWSWTWSPQCRWRPTSRRQTSNRSRITRWRARNSFVKFCESLRSHPAWLLVVVGSPLFPDCRLHTDSILTTALFVQCRFVQEDDVRKPKVENWTNFAPCCLCCGRYCRRARCAQFWRQLREVQHRLF